MRRRVTMAEVPAPPVAPCSDLDAALREERRAWLAHLRDVASQATADIARSDPERLSALVAVGREQLAQDLIAWLNARGV